MDKKARGHFQRRDIAGSEPRFYCPRCKRTICALKSSQLFEAWQKVTTSKEKALMLLALAHYRHRHTEYHKEMEALHPTQTKYDFCREFQDKGLDFKVAWELASVKYQIEREKIKKRCNEEAAKLIFEDLGIDIKKKIKEIS